MESQATIKKHFVTGFVLLALLFSGISPLALAKKNDVKKQITTSSVHAQLAFLASDALEGRDAGSTGGKVAGEYIVQHFREWNIKPYFPYETYCQTFSGKRVPDRQTISGMRNIVGMIEGENRNEYIIVGAHYDHLGVGTPIDGDSIYNGADDNASGTVAVLQLAKAFAARKKQPKRTILFTLWDGEERGLLGSYYFANNFADSSQIKACVNFDMIGRETQEEQPNQFTFHYASTYPIFTKWAREAIEKQKLNLSPNFNPLKNYYIYGMPLSDYIPFALRNRPFIFYTAGHHHDMHKPSDEIDQINIDKTTAIIQSAYYVIEQLAEQTDYPSEPANTSDNQ